MRHQYKAYKFGKFEDQLKSLQNTISGRNSRKNEDSEAFENYLSHNKPSTKSHIGYIPYQDSIVQELLLEKLQEGLDKSTGGKGLWESRSEYWQFPLKISEA